MGRGAVHPGAEPPRFRFPFAEASAAMASVSALIDEIDLAVRRHEDAAAAVRPGFEGLARARFDRDLEAALDELRRLRRLLAADLGDLGDDLDEARRRAEAAEEARRRWRADLRRWRAEQDAR